MYPDGCEYDPVGDNPKIIPQVIPRALDAMARYFSEEKGAFLKAPGAATYAMETSEPAPDDEACVIPVVSKRLLLACSHGGMKQEIDKSYFSRLKDQIVLVWPDYFLPLNAVFERPYAEAWIVARCRAAFPDRTTWANVDHEKVNRRLKKKKEDLDLGATPEPTLIRWLKHFPSPSFRAQAILEELSNGEDIEKDHG